MSDGNSDNQDNGQPQEENLDWIVELLDNTGAFVSGIKRAINDTTPLGLIEIGGSKDYGNPMLWEREAHNNGRITGTAAGIVIDLALIYGAVALFNKAMEYMF